MARASNWVICRNGEKYLSDSGGWVADLQKASVYSEIDCLKEDVTELRSARPSDEIKAVAVKYVLVLT